MRALLILSMALILTACQQSSPSEPFFRLQKKAMDCLNNEKKDNACQTAVARYRLLRAAALKLKESPQGFGLEIIHLQDKVVSLKQKLSQKNIKSKEKQDLLKTLKKTQAALAINTEIVRYFESP